MDTQPSRSSVAGSGPLNRRPAKVTSLICQGGVYDDWFFANKSKNRFYVVNLNRVMGELNINWTVTKPYFEQAREIILLETNWQSDYSSTYECSHTQLQPPKANEAKHFGHAATIIVAMEMAAREKDPNYNVYNFLRILPAQYFVDRLDQSRFEELAKCYDNWNESERIEKFGDRAIEKSFEDLCLECIEHSFCVDLLSEIASGHCITSYTADLLINFVNNHFPQKFHVGPVLGSGQDSISKMLGTKRAALSLKVPKRINQDKFEPCQ
jgi:hypothetical protein